MSYQDRKKQTQAAAEVFPPDKRVTCRCGKSKPRYSRKCFECWVLKDLRPLAIDFAHKEEQP